MIEQLLRLADMAYQADRLRPSYERVSGRVDIKGEEDGAARTCRRADPTRPPDSRTSRRGDPCTHEGRGAPHEALRAHTRGAGEGAESIRAARIASAPSPAPFVLIPQGAYRAASRCVGVRHGRARAAGQVVAGRVASSSRPGRWGARGSRLRLVRRDSGVCGSSARSLQQGSWGSRTSARRSRPIKARESISRRAVRTPLTDDLAIGAGRAIVWAARS